MEHKMERAIGLLSIARKAGKLRTGEETVGAMLAQRVARLTVLASDAGAATVRQILGQAEGTRQRVLRLPCDKQTLGAALGRQTVSVAAFTDVSLALAFVRALPDEAADPEVLRDLEARVERVKARRKQK